MAEHPKNTGNKEWRAFVLMPFEPEFNVIYSDVIKPALKEVGYAVERADSTLDQRSILADIVRGIVGADLIVADITTLDENVLYELGLSHGLGIPTVLLTQSIDSMPFDLRPYRAQGYSTHFAEISGLANALREIGRKHKEGKLEFSNPVTDFAPQVRGVIEKARTPATAGAAPEREPGAASGEEKGFLDFVVEGEQASGEIAHVFNGFAEQTAALRAQIEEHSSRLEALHSSATPGAAADAHKIALLAATNMNAYSESIEASLPGLSASVNRLVENYSGYLGWLEPKTEDEILAVKKLRDVLAELGTGTTSTLDSTRSYRAVIATLRSQRISKALSAASRRLIEALDGIISTMETVEAFSARAVVLLSDRLGESQAGTGSNRA